ncbi:MAG: hypothetical protein N2235_12720 [Fischerella sp.]|nr:hypothetical protein [Fischerella sp.]
MSLVDVDLPPPSAMRGGWAALAAVLAARGWGRDVYAEPNQWLYHDGGGNWASLRFVESNKILLVGHDREYSETYFRKAAEYFGEEETDLLKGAPDWWGSKLDPRPFGEWIGFVYGWDGRRWQRAEYDVQDGFEQVGLLKACSLTNIELLKEYVADAPGLCGMPPSDEALRALVSADAQITPEMLQRVIPGWDVEAGVAAARKFLEMRV